ncbi:polysaccharide deacetylase family protein [Algihabitans albus]|uniref:polysaccharide deacetylase family protein n=1 Tax=Algihabitans albus TaxID=2164067 RepID=UPI000E5C5C41|nr:polysaccharide deacetylase family protein [Algihabitans albus]
MVWAGLAAVAALTFIWFLVPFAYRKYEENRLARLCRDQKTIVLSYDDGPGETLTPLLLDLLLEHRAQATFFFLGRNVEGKTDIAQRLISEGHEIGSHTQDHSNAWKTEPWRVARDLRSGIRTVETLGGDAKLFRPPYGKLTIVGLLDGLAGALRFGWWTVDSRDSWDRRPVEDVVAEVAAKGGGVVLMHDFDRYGPPSNGVSHIDHVLALTKGLLDCAERSGYRVRRLTDVYKTAAEQRG